MRFFFLVLSFWGMLDSAEAQQRVEEVSKKSEGVLIVVDRSGSMWDQLGSVKTQAASLLDRLGPQDPAGLIHFSGCGPESIVYGPALKRGNADAIKSSLSSLEADGDTDLAGALRVARGVMEQTDLCPQVALFTDNFDTCEGNPGMEILDSDAFCMEINVITSSVDQTVVQSLEKLSEMTHGKTYFAETAEEANKALSEIARKAKDKSRLRASLRARRNKQIAQGAGDAEESDGAAKKRERERARARLESEQKKEREESGR